MIPSSGVVLSPGRSSLFHSWSYHSEPNLALSASQTAMPQLFLASQINNRRSANSNKNGLLWSTTRPSETPTLNSSNSGSNTKRHARFSPLHQRVFHRDPYPSSPVAMSSKAPGADTDLLPAYSPTHSESEQHHAHYPFISSTITTLQESRTFWLSLYFCFNLSLTLYNKSVLVRFPFPYTLTAIHALFGTIGGTALVRCGVYVPVKLKPSETAVLAAFSVLYAFNIVVSNASLQLVTVAFHQVIRSSTPIFTIFFCAVLLGKHTSRAKMVSLSPVVFGVCLATYGDYYFTRLGFFLTLLGTVLAALKTIFTSVLQSPPPSATSTSPTTRSSITFKISGFHWGVVPFPRLHPLDLLHLLSPLAFIQCVLLAYFSGELDRVRVFAAQEMTPFKVTALSMNGCLAFGLNVVSFSANKRVGPVGMTVAANVKQVLTMLCAVVVFNLTITPANGLGIILTLVGGAWYAYVEYEEKREVPEAKWVETEK